MPLDPNISLSYQPPQIQNPLATLAQVQALKNQQLQSQTSQLELQNQQRTLAGQQALDNAMRTAVTMGPDGTPVFNRQAVSDSLSQGGFGHLVPGVMKSLTDTETAYADLAKKKADLTKLNQDIAQNNLDAGGLLALTVQKAGNTPGAALGAIAFAKAHGQLDPATAENLAQQITANPTPDAVKQLTDNLIAQSPKAQTILKGQQEAAAATETAETRRRAEGRQQQEFDIKAPGERADAAKKEFQNAVPSLLRAVGTPAYAQAYQALSPDAQKIAPSPESKPTIADVTRASMTPAEAQTAAHQTVEERQAQQGLGLRAQEVGISGARLAVERMNAGLDPKTGQPIQYTDAQGNPVNVSPVARQIAAYKLPPPAARSMASAQGKNLMNQVLTVNPDFDIGQYEERYKTMQDLRPGGKLGQNALALNTLVRHTEDMFDAIQALKNGDVQALNAAKQKMAQWMGSAAPTNFDQWRQFVVGETVKSIRGQGGNQKDEEEARAPLERANSPEQLLGAMNVNLAATGGKLRALNQAVRPVIGDSKFTALDPDAQEILQKRGYDPETMKPVAKGGAGGAGGISIKAPNGRTYIFATPQQADAFKKAAGIQ